MSKAAKGDRFKIEFEKSLNRFLKSVASRNIKIFNQFLNPSLHFWALLPGGKIYENVDDFKQSQLFWFENNLGDFNFEILNSRAKSNLGWALVEVRLYLKATSKDKARKTRIFITLLGFQKQKSRWYLVHDQNTVVSG